VAEAGDGAAGTGQAICRVQRFGGRNTTELFGRMIRRPISDDKSENARAGAEPQPVCAAFL